MLFFKSTNFLLTILNFSAIDIGSPDKLNYVHDS